MIPSQFIKAIIGRRFSYTLWKYKHPSGVYGVPRFWVEWRPGVFYYGFN